jgi:predicted cation transporter
MEYNSLMSLPDHLESLQVLGLLFVVIIVFTLPLLFNVIEENIELFLLLSGALAVSISSKWDLNLIYRVIERPIPLVISVLLFGLAFYYGRKYVVYTISLLSRNVSEKTFVFCAVVIVGLISSIITAVIAAFLLVEVTKNMLWHRHEKVRFVVYSCFSIGLGASLTPIGEPLSTVVTAQMGGDFFYLFRLLGFYVVPLILLLGAIAAFVYDWGVARQEPDLELEVSTSHDALIRAGKVYAFVCALLLLGAGLEPVASQFAEWLTAPLLFWVNGISAIVDNATLAAAEITTSLNANQVTAALLGLLISGGMLIPGNIPNIIAANHLRIRSREWAKVGTPLGLLIMTFTFFVWFGVSRILG